MLVREMIRNVYKECKGVPKSSCLTKEQRLSLQMDEFMNRRYEFRYNTQIGEVEYRERFSFRVYFSSPLTNGHKTASCSTHNPKGIGVWDRDIDRYLHSNRVPIYNPFGRVSVSSASLGRQRPYSCFGKQGSLQESALGIAFPPLVPEYGFTLERGR